MRESTWHFNLPAHETSIPKTLFPVKVVTEEHLSSSNDISYVPQKKPLADSKNILTTNG